MYKIYTLYPSQVNKPILLEGFPGVGKTSIVAALSRLLGYELTRINLSEQTVRLLTSLSIFPCLFLPLCLSLSLSLSLCLYLYLSLRLSLYLYLSTSISLPLSLPLCLSLSLSLSLCRTLYLYVALSTSIFFYIYCFEA